MDSYFIYRLGELIAKQLPLKQSYALAENIGALQYRFSRVDRENIEGNLNCIFNRQPDKVAELTPQVFKNFGKYLVDFFRFSLLDKKFFEQQVEYHGLEYISESLAYGKGAVVVTAHLGNWELCGAALAMNGYPISAIALPHKNKRVDDFFVRQRVNMGVKVIPMGVAVRRSFKVLQQNGLLGIVGDRDFSGEHGIFMDFFGKPLMVPRGPAIMSLRCGAPIVPVFMVRKEDGFTYKFIADRPIVSRHLAGEEENVRDISGRTLEVIKQYVAAYANQWFMFRPYWIPEKII